MSDTGAVARPLIVVTAPDAVPFQPPRGGKPKTARPTRQRQAERLDDRFDELDRLLSGSSSATATDALPSGDPELVIVFEVVESTTDIAEAFRRAGLEPLIDIEDEFTDDELGDDFARIRPGSATSEPIKRYIHAGMANEAAVTQLVALWRRWKQGERMPNGAGPFSTLFARLHDLRRWGPADRVRSTGLADLLIEVFSGGLVDVPINVELWPRASAERRQLAERAVTDVLVAAGGEVLGRAEHLEIGYHALAARLPAPTLEPLLGKDLAALEQVALLRAPDVLFVRPGGQRARVELDDDLPDAPPSVDPEPVLPPLLAVLDGLPEANHPLLRGRLEIVDPDDLGGDPRYTVERRRHGTMVASAVIWGDRAAGHAATERRIAIRPVMRPDLTTAQADESIPWEWLPASVTLASVRDLVGTAAAPGPVPTVRVVNISLGDELAQFDTIPSGWARAIDWLAYEHNILFVISAGNHSGPIPISDSQIAAATGAERDRLTSAALAELSPRRRLLTPAESLNALTVGALHADAAGDSHPLGYRFDLWTSPGQPSPTTAHGRGIRRAIKPDIAAPGGRQLYSRGAAPGVVSPARGTAVPPGIEVAAPPDKLAYVSGTTFAAAEVSRRAVRLIEALQASDPPVNDRDLAVAAKALLVHGATFPADAEYGIAADRLVGYGSLERDLAVGCRPSQATMLFTGSVGDREQVELIVPFPHDVAAITNIRRITTTLAWFSPINWNHRQYRRAKLTLDGPTEIPSSGRRNLGADYHLSRRGTVEHHVFETSRAIAHGQLTFAVKCSGQAGGLVPAIPFALAVTLEVGDGVNIDVYDLVRTEVQARPRIRAT